jgi:hypothetical protein
LTAAATPFLLLFFFRLPLPLLSCCCFFSGCRCHSFPAAVFFQAATPFLLLFFFRLPLPLLSCRLPSYKVSLL